MAKQDHEWQPMKERFRLHRRKQPHGKEDKEHHKKHHQDGKQDGKQGDKKDGKQDGSRSADHSNNKGGNSPDVVKPTDDPGTNDEPQQPVQPPGQPTPSQPATPSSGDSQAPVAVSAIEPSPQAQRMPAVDSAPHSTGSPNIGVIAGAAAGGVVLLLAVIGLVVYRCSRRKNAGAARAKPATRPNVIHSPWTSRSDLMGSLTDIQYPSYKGDDRQQQWPYLQRDRSRTSQPGQDHVEVSLPLPPAQGDDCEDKAEPVVKSILAEQSRVELSQLGALPDEALSPRDDQLRRPSLREADATVDGDDAQIDRCLSYYMKRRTCASMQPEPMSALPSPVPRDMQDLPPPPASPARAPNSAVRRSFKFAKTANLLDKIRRSQIRLNDEALSKAQSEGFRLSRAPSARAAAGKGEDSRLSCASSANSTEATKYDASPSFSPETHRDGKIPAHWRPHSKVHYKHGHTLSGVGDADVLGSSPAGSEPHSAFEYAEYYDTYHLPAVIAAAAAARAHTPPARLALTPNGAEDAFALPWANHSPCRSSALSPRRSENASMRQRSATFSQASPLAWPASAGSEVHDGADAVAGARGFMGGVATQRESALVDEVIRF